MPFDGVRLSRRQALAAGGSALGALSVASLLPAPLVALADDDHGDTLPVKRMEEILQAKGSVTDGVLVVELDRTDIGTVHLHGAPIKPSFEVNGDVCFQPIGDNLAFFNGDLALKESEVDPFIDAILANGLIFQAFHQHFYDFHPPVWFIHWRGRGEPLALARRVHNCIAATSTPLPQAPPAHPTTPLDPERLKDILHGFDASVGSDGVVTVLVARRNPVYIDGIKVKPANNIATNIVFESLNSSGSSTAVAPDFGMTWNEVDPVMRVMRGQGWDIGCLYNQETNESPQLFFSHQFKTGDPYALARECRRGLDQTNSY
jgi:Domain of Unknown Function (DUF1259)